MSEAVMVIGPSAVRGPGAADPALVSVALECVDERLAVYDDRIVAVRRLWCDVVQAVCPEGCESVVLVVPTWWPGSRVEFVEDVLIDVCARVVVLRRGGALCSGGSTVVELGPDCVVVQSPDGERSVVSRSDRAEFVVEAVLATLSAIASVVIDVPGGLGGAEQLAEELARRLRRRNVEVSLVDDDAVRCAVEADRRVDFVPSPRRRARVDRRRLAVVAGALVTVAALSGAAATTGVGASVDADVAWVVEGRLAVEVPADWTVERVTVGPGSARVRVISAMDERFAVHVTQARVPDHETMQATAETLKAALDAQPDGVFADFVADDRKADRPAVRYTEVRSEVAVDWVVVLDRGLRIAIGCQHPRAGSTITPACERAVRTAHAIP